VAEATATVYVYGAWWQVADLDPQSCEFCRAEVERLSAAVRVLRTVRFWELNSIPSLPFRNSAICSLVRQLAIITSVDAAGYIFIGTVNGVECRGNTTGNLVWSYSI